MGMGKNKEGTNVTSGELEQVNWIVGTRWEKGYKESKRERG